MQKAEEVLLKKHHLVVVSGGVKIEGKQVSSSTTTVAQVAQTVDISTTQPDDNSPRLTTYQSCQPNNVAPTLKVTGTSNYGTVGLIGLGALPTGRLYFEAKLVNFKRQLQIGWSCYNATYEDNRMHGLCVWCRGRLPSLVRLSPRRLIT